MIEPLASPSFDISAPVFERAAEVFGLLATPARLRILNVLWEREMNVTDMSGALGVAQPNLSQHLTLLYRSGLLARRRSGAQVFYRVNPDSGGLLCQAVRSLLEAGGLPGGLASAAPEAASTLHGNSSRTWNEK